METVNEIVAQLEQIKLVPVVVLEDATDADKIAKALIDGGVPCAEVTFRTAAAKEVIQKMHKAFPQMLVGAGTVLDQKQAADAVEAGAKFIVSPGLNEHVVSYCLEHKIPVVPGIATPSEAEKAISMGLSFVKFFPAEAAGGLKMLKSLSGPYPNLRFMPTGGITPKNIKEYLSFSKIFACGGSFMITDEIIKEKAYEKITQICKDTLEKLNSSNEKNEQSREENLDARAKKIDTRLICDKTKKVVTLGEIMLRLQPFGYKRFVQAEAFESVFGGSEANIALSLSNMDVETKFVTKLPEHAIADNCIHYLKEYGVDTKSIIRGGERMGIYFIEKGAAQRPSKVIYDRENSAMALAKKDEFDWDAIFSDAKWFHFSGISAGLSKTSFEICKEACKQASKRGIFISCDFNYRKKMWTLKEAGEALKQLLPYINAFWGITSREYLKEAFDLEIKEEDFHKDTPEKEKIARTIVDAFGLSFTAITERKSDSASDNTFQGMLYCKNKAYYSREYQIHIVDRVGAGDSFAAGLIFGFINQMTMEDTIEFAAAAACLKHSIDGDCNLVNAEEVSLLALGEASGRVDR